MSFTADFPGAIVVEAATWGYPSKARGNNNSKAWGLHTPEEPADATPSTPYYFHNLTGRNASTTYFVAWTGLVFQCVPEDAGAYGQGREGVPGYFDWENPNVNMNLQSWSIEIEGYASTIHLTMPRGSPQWVSLVRLMAHRCKAKNVPPERTFGHYQVSIYRSDPGQLDIGALISDVKALLGQEDEMDADEKAAFRKFFVDPHGEPTYNAKYPGRESWTRADVIFVSAAWLDAAHLATLFEEHKAILDATGTGGGTGPTVSYKITGTASPA